MDLIVFDLDGTLLNSQSQVSDHTRETLRRLSKKNIAYTVATGRTLHASRNLIDGHGFAMPHIYKNGVMIWLPEHDSFSHSTLLTSAEIMAVIQAFDIADVSPFIFTLQDSKDHTVYHPPLRNDSEKGLVEMFARDRGLIIKDIGALPENANISNISALGSADAISEVATHVEDEEHLVAYAGVAFEGRGLHWIDVHHSSASKGTAIEQLKAEFGVTRVICFGDSENDLSMFAMADESYAPSNAKESVLAAATKIIGHHDEDGVSHFLRERFDL